MQLGTRWAAGDEPPAALPAEFVAAVREVEADLPPDAVAGLRWTLTWRERRPWVELDDGTLLEPGVDGGVEIVPAQD